MINPFFFRKLPSTESVFISNLLGEWSVLDSYEDLLKLTAGVFDTSVNEELALKGFISNTPADKLHFNRAAELGLANKFSKNTNAPSLIMVVPTLRCDHDCMYCQVSRAPLSSKDHDLELSPKVTARVIDKIAANSFKLEIQGGEPLLRPQYIKDLVNEMRSLRGSNFGTVITTALGPELSEDFLDWAINEDVSFSVSFDGIPRVHSAIRKSKLFDSFDRLKQQLIRLSSAGLISRVGYVHTLTRETLDSGPLEIIKSCKELGISRLYSRPLADYGFAVATKKRIGYSRGELEVFLERYLDEIIACFNRGENFFDQSFGVHLKNLYRPESNTHVDIQSPAGYAMSACIINYDGNVFGSDEARMLYESTKNSVLPLGKIINDKLVPNKMAAHESILSSSFSELTPHCDTCAYMPFCGSDPIHHLASQGDFVGFKPNSDFCQQTITMNDLLINKIKSGEITNEMVALWLNH